METLYDNAGDCEDKVFLFVSLAEVSKDKLGFNYDVACQILPGHMSVAVKISGVRGDKNPYDYLYGETTAKRYTVGNIPSKMKECFVNASYYPDKSFTVIID